MDMGETLGEVEEEEEMFIEDEADMGGIILTKEQWLSLFMAESSVDDFKRILFT